MGYDNNNYEEYTAGYCEAGDRVTFKVLDASTGELIEMKTNGNMTWENNLISDVPPKVTTETIELKWRSTFLGTHLVANYTKNVQNPFSPKTLPYSTETLYAPT